MKPTVISNNGKNSRSGNAPHQGHPTEHPIDRNNDESINNEGGNADSNRQFPRFQVKYFLSINSLK